MAPEKLTVHYIHSCSNCHAKETEEIFPYLFNALIAVFRNCPVYFCTIDDIFFFSIYHFKIGACIREDAIHS